MHFRRSQYEIDSRLLEAPFYEHFRQKTPSVEFVIDPDLEQSVQESQQALLQDLHKRHLVCTMLALLACPCCIFSAATAHCTLCSSASVLHRC